MLILLFALDSGWLSSLTNHFASPSTDEDSTFNDFWSFAVILRGRRRLKCASCTADIGKAPTIACVCVCVRCDEQCPDFRAIFCCVQKVLSRGQKPKVYIHCTAGMGRAPAVACVYMVKYMQGYTLDQALEHVKRHRTVAAPNWFAMEKVGACACACARTRVRVRVSVHLYGCVWTRRSVAAAVWHFL